MLFLANLQIKILVQWSVHLHPHHRPCLPTTPSHVGQKEVSTQDTCCWIACYFSRPTGPDLARGGVGVSEDRTCRAGVGAQNFLCFTHLQVGHQ